MYYYIADGAPWPVLRPTEEKVARLAHLFPHVIYYFQEQ